MTIKEVLEKIDREMEQLKKENENFSQRIWKPDISNKSLEAVVKDLSEENEKLKAKNVLLQFNDKEYLGTLKKVEEENDRLKAEILIKFCNDNVKLQTENKLLKAKLQKYESDEPQYCDVSGVKLDKKVKCPICNTETRSYCQVCSGRGIVFRRP